MVSKKIILKLIKKGNKVCSEKIYLDLLRKLKFELGVKNPVAMVETIIENISTPVTLISKKVGGTVYQIPVPVKKGKDVSIGVGWLLEYVNTVKDVKMVLKLYNEILLIKKTNP